MKKRLLIKRKILRKVLNALGVCSVGLIAACAKYGAEISTSIIKLTGTVKSNDSLKAIENINLQVTNGYYGESVQTDENGNFVINEEIEGYEVNLSITDVDSNINGSFSSKDTTLDLSSEEIESGEKSDIDIKLERDE